MRFEIGCLVGLSVSLGIGCGPQSIYDGQTIATPPGSPAAPQVHRTQRATPPTIDAEVLRPLEGELGDPVSEQLFPVTGPDDAACAPPIDGYAANTIYVCDCQPGAADGCWPGDDANSGTSRDAPKRSFRAARIAFSSASLGGHVALCRGGAWVTGPERFAPSASCSAADPCVLGDYGDANLPKPLVLAQGVSSNALTVDVGDNSIRGGCEVRNLHLSRAEDVGTGVGIFVFRAISDFTVRCMEIDNFAIGMNVAANGQPMARVILDNSYVRDNAYHGFLGGCDGCEVTANDFYNNGHGGGSAFEHNVYASAASAPNTTVDNMRVSHNRLRRNSVNAETGQCSGTSLNMHGGVFNDPVIEYNQVEEPRGGASGGCWGIAVDGATGEVDAAYRAVIRGNVVRNVGNVGIGIASCVDCIIESNLVIQRSGWTVGIAAPNRISAAEDVELTAATVRNNTVWYGDGGTGLGVLAGGIGTDHVVTSNIVAFEPGISPSICYEYDLGPQAYLRVDSNLGHNCDTLERGTAGMDANLGVEDPLFRNPPWDFRPGEGSSALDSADPSSVAGADLVGQTRGTPADRGAHEVD